MCRLSVDDYAGGSLDFTLDGCGDGKEVGDCQEVHPSMTPRHKSKYPLMHASFESTEYPRLFFAGTLTHARDYRVSSGGFVHGFRYTARALYRLLEERRAACMFSRSPAMIQ